MFGSNNRRHSGQTAVQSARFSVIGSDIAIIGDLIAEEDLHFDGKITGDLTCAELVQADGSVIQGSVKAGNARIGGRIEGSIETVELVVEASADIKGDILYDRITVAEGARIEGQISKRAITTETQDGDADDAEDCDNSVGGHDKLKLAAMTMDVGGSRSLDDQLHRSSAARPAL